MNTSAVLFVNFTDEDFVHSWNSVTYTFKAGTSMYLEPWLAEHFSKHLVDREINKLNDGKKPLDEIRIDNQQLRNSFLEKCVKTVETKATGDAQLKTELLNLNMNKETPGAEVSLDGLTAKPFCETCDAKGPIKHKKACPKNNASSPKE